MLNKVHFIRDWSELVIIIFRLGSETRSTEKLLKINGDSKYKHTKYILDVFYVVQIILYHKS